jgi:hypothetical protein
MAAHCHKRQAPPIRAHLGSGSRDGIRSGDNPGRSYPYRQLIDCLPGNGLMNISTPYVTAIWRLLSTCSWNVNSPKEFGKRSAIVHRCLPLILYIGRQAGESQNGSSRWPGCLAQRSIRVRDPSLSSFAGPCGKSEMQEFSNLKRRHSLGHYRKTTNLLGPKP